MCKEGVRIGRQLAVEGGTAAALAAGVAAVLVRGRPDRYSLTVSIDTVEPPAMTRPVRLLAGGATGPCIGAVGVYSPTLTLTVDQLGTALTGEIWAVNTEGYSLGLYYAEAFWTEPLEKL